MTDKARYSLPEAGGEAIQPTIPPLDTPRPVFSEKSPGSTDPSVSQPLPVQEPPILLDKGQEPGYADLNQPHTSAAGSEKPFSSQTTPDPAATCCCGVVVAKETFSEGPDHDPAEWYRRCPLHEKDSKAYWFVDTLVDLRDIRGTLTPEGVKFTNELRRESDKKNPYIPELDRVKAKIEKVDEFLAGCLHAREKEKEWNQQFNVSLASKGVGIPYPDWLRKYSRENQKIVETRRDELFNEKLEIQQKIVNHRYGLNTNRDRS